MKKIIKNLTLITFLAFSISSISIAQVTKSDIEEILVLQETMLNSIEEIQIENAKSLSSDGSIEYRTFKYKKLKLSLSESSLIIKIDSVGVLLIPYSSIHNLYLFNDKVLNITLSE